MVHQEPLLQEQGNADRKRVYLRRATTQLFTYFEPCWRAALRGILVMLALLATMVGFSFAYVFELDDDKDGDLNDKAGGWAQDMLLAMLAVLFLLSSRLVVEDRYWLFYAGTAVAYGLGGAAHFLEDSTSATGLTAYYAVMTLAFGGDALRSSYGYGLPPSPHVKWQCAFTALTFGCLCVTASATLLALLQGCPASRLQQSPLGLAYKSAQIGMGFVEMSGSVVWFHAVRLDIGPWSLFPTAMNVSAWLLVKFQPVFHQQLHIKTTVSHQLAHYMQVVVIWCLQTINLRREFDSRNLPDARIPQSVLACAP